MSPLRMSEAGAHSWARGWLNTFSGYDAGRGAYMTVPSPVKMILYAARANSR